MKLKTSASATFLLPGAPIDDVISKVGDAGFDALEFQVLAPGDAERFAPAINASHLEVALINFGVDDFAKGGTGLSGVPGRSEDFNAALEQAYLNAGLLSATVAHVGPSRIPRGVHPDRCIAQLVDNLGRALNRFSTLTTRLSIEPLNRTEFPDVLIGSADAALEVIEAVGDDRLVLQYDIYHGARDGRDVLQDLETCLTRIGHVQFADCPGRREPGTGTIAFDEIFAALRAARYGGFVGAEYFPSRRFQESLEWMALLDERNP